MSIRKKLTILFLAVGVIPVIVVSLFAYSAISEQLITKTVEQIRSISQKQNQRLLGLLQAK